MSKADSVLGLTDQAKANEEEDDILSLAPSRKYFFQ